MAVTTEAKKHDMAFVITGLTLAIFCGRDGSLTSLHRHMANRFETLCGAVQIWPERVISRAQLPLLLARVNGELLAQLLFDGAARAVVWPSSERRGQRLVHFRR